MDQLCINPRAAPHPCHMPATADSEPRSFSGPLPSVLETQRVLDGVRPPRLAARGPPDCPGAGEEAEVTRTHLPPSYPKMRGHANGNESETSYPRCRGFTVNQTWGFPTRLLTLYVITSLGLSLLICKIYINTQEDGKKSIKSLMLKKHSADGVITIPCPVSDAGLGLLPSPVGFLLHSIYSRVCTYLLRNLSWSNLHHGLLDQTGSVI